ncbi:hypothetical protein [Pseudomonas sp. IT-P74]|uniref:hypothetical protein n=1 Tax=Pseudomonas sp. IT-P74 TaxID=3026445 RepID=UPI0039E06652
MSTTVEQWKAQIESEIRNNIEKYIVVPELSSAGVSAEYSDKSLDFKRLGLEAKITYAADEFIQRYIDDPKTAAIDGLCCLVCLDTIFGKACVTPVPGGPCNMC